MNVCGLSGNDSLGYIIAHSNCRWTLRLYNDYLEHKEIEMFVATAISNDTCSKIVNLTMLSSGDTFLVSPNTLHMFIADMKHMLSLEKLSLQLPVYCSCIAWPDLSQLRVLHLEISGERNWKFSSLLPRLTLDTLIISSTASKYGLCL